MKGDEEREYCRRCGRYTNQAIIGHECRTVVNELDQRTDFIHEMIRCLGCDKVIMRATENAILEEISDIASFAEYYVDAIPCSYYHEGDISRRQEHILSGNEVPPEISSLMREPRLSAQPTKLCHSTRTPTLS
jgi:hypothetical protein